MDPLIFKHPEYKYALGEHKNKKVIWIGFEKKQALIDPVKKLVSAKWSQSNHSWYVTDTPAYRQLFDLPIKDMDYTDTAISEMNQAIYRRCIEHLQLKAYSLSTIKTYRNDIASFLKILNVVPAGKISPEKLRSYFLYCINTLKLSESTVHSKVNALKFLYEQVLHREKFFFEIPRPQRPEKLPKVLNEREIKQLFKSTQNNKHRMILMLTYGMGLRVSEVVNLKIRDIDSKRMQVLIEAAKGKKDRYVNLPESIIKELRAYYLTYKPDKYLFEGQYGGQYTIRSVQAVFKTAMNAAKINKRIGIHGLRHSYATHLLEAGTDITFIQSLLGHNDIKTTQIYAKVGRKEVQNVKSPLDRL